MKKIININLSGRVIPIEDAAYESLQRYIESLRRYFANEEGRDEIINDIESRIAELMNDRVRRGAAAVTEADMEEIIASMGRVEDFEEADAAEATTTGTAGSQAGTGNAAGTESRRFKGRLYRDSSDKMLGGVCSGLANYMNVDPAIVRLLFAIITFGGFGLGIFLYILAWIILPARDLDGYVGKRLFRNPDDKILGGVCGGLAAYFNRETWIVRLIFAAPLLLNILFSFINGIFNVFHRGPGVPDFFFGSFTGTFVLAYIVLWIVLPEARSPFEKMEMRGERVDVNRIRQNVQEGMGDLGKRAQAWSEEVRESAERLGQRASTFANTRGKTFAAEVSQAARPAAQGLGHAIGVLFKAFFLFIAGVIAFALFVMVLVFTFGGVAQPLNNFFLNGFDQKLAMWGILIFFLAVPLIAVITWIVRRLMKVRSQNRYLGWTFGGLWTLGWVCLFYFIASVGRDWRYESRVSQDVVVPPTNMNRMVVRIDEPKIEYSGTFGWLHDDHNDRGGWDITEDSIRLSNVKIRVAKSADPFYHVTLWKESRGSNRQDAAQRASLLTYSASTLDSALVLGSGFGVGKAQKFRGQRVIVEVQVPVGKIIRFDETVSKLEFTNIRIAERSDWRNRRWEVDWDNDSYYDWEPGIDYVMNENGDLVNPNKPTTTTTTTTTTPGGVYEYKKNSGEPTKKQDSLRKVIEEKERQLEEDRKRLEQVEKQDGTTFLRNGNQSTAKQDMSLLSPVFSLII
ncbi:PspC domain-containing protein [Flavisolibacter tropicus]|uniref:PspC domain-containing protein n=1 Tax=Flavisolibacter tropicus TaxID=1492898 RepID=UPI00082ED12E|nr:PspC domain-containing protein [Flavisolibacter tropicus]